MTKKDRQQLEYDIYYACECLDEVFAMVQLVRDYLENEENTIINKWKVRQGLGGIMSLIIDIQCNLEQSIENKTVEKEDDDGRC